VTVAKPGAYRSGDGRVPTPDDIGRAVRLMAIAAALLLPGVVALAMR
jgi:cobalamin biosynthesis protein CobD/CbiB